MTHLSRRQARAITGTTKGVYADFMKAKGRPEVIQELGDDARLFWFGPRKADRVLLFFHGGAFLFPALSSTPWLWDHAQDILSKRGVEFDIAMLNYTLIPDAPFPTQLKQAVLAIQHLIDTGIKPSHIQLTGDSAGGALIHQVLSHILHPLAGVPELSLSEPLGGAYMMSPWTSLTDSSLLRSNQGRGDLVSVPIFTYWGSIVLSGVPTPDLPYIDAYSAPQSWLDGSDKAIKRILVSAGEHEILRDAIVDYAKEKLGNHHRDVAFYLEDKGVHDQPFLNFLTGDKDTGKLTSFIIDWLDNGFCS
ncbi:Esterase [Psilocybe cubensis]|uniref:Esterase n=2 Tax=Psilocybe cubensis TaxID=181762 RepID=A0ACB8GHY8_PSICU|nr:Esterase [Psilocybe cubensis]KAH9474982.1 Esterase [Psilocybe cubensis]